MAGLYALQLADGTLLPVEEAAHIGRDPINQVHLTDPLVSRLHATVWQAGQTLYVRDEGSSNGTFVNGKMLNRPQQLRQGDRLRVGNTAMTVVAGPTGQLRPHPAPDATVISDAPDAPAGRRSWKPWLALGIGAGGLVLCALTAVGALTLFRFLRADPAPPGTGPTPEAGVSPGQAAFQAGFRLEPVETLTVSPNGELIADEHGMGARVPTDAGSTSRVVRSDLGEELSRMLEESYNVRSEAYSISTAGDQDAAGRAELRFPAPSPEARLGVIVDQKYLAILATEPRDGALWVQPRLGANGGTGEWDPEEIDGHHTQYLVLEPKGSATSGGRGAGPASVRSAPGDEDDILHECGDWWHTYCRRNASGTVYLFYDKYTLLAYPLLQVIETVEGIMARYQGLGLTAATLTPETPLYIVIGDSGPHYSSVTGNMYIPWDIVEKVQTPQNSGTLAHELAHWVEDENYAMSLEAFSHEHFWWLEMAAENLSMLYEPSRLGGNLTFYGKVSDDGGRYSFQLDPFRWESNEEARYIQAQNVNLGMCDDPACPISQEDLVEAINQGTFPYSEGSAKQNYYQMLPEVARYLLGFVPRKGNTAVRLPEAVAAGNGYGEYITARSQGEETVFEHLSYAPQTTVSAGEVQINAQIAHGGLYPLRVSNSGQAAGVNTPWSAGHPIYLEIAPGAPLLYSVDKGEPVQVDGGSGLFFAPIHDDLGIELMRLVGLAAEGAETLQATIGFVDLSGDWRVDELSATSFSSSCETEEGEGGDDLEEDFFLQLLAAYGTFEADPADPTGKRLIWVRNQPLPEDAAGVQIEGAVTLGQQDVQLTYRIYVPEGTSGLVPGARVVASQGQGVPPEAAWGWLLPLPFLAWTAAGGRGASRRRATLARLALGLALVALLSGCALDVFGTIQGEYTFKKMTYLSEDYSRERPTTDIWRLEDGQGTLNMDLTFVTEDEDGELMREQCVLNYGFEGAATVIEDGVITPADVQ